MSSTGEGAAMLNQLDGGIWTITRRFRRAGLSFASRMTVIRLADASLWVHSPVRLTPDLREALDALGPVLHVVAPNRLHHMFCADYGRAYAAASLWCAPGLAAKRKDLRFRAELGDAAPDAWAGQVDQAVVAGFPLLNEVAFLHRSTGTLILTDLVANGSRDDPAPLRLWLRLNDAYGEPGTTRLVRRLCRDRTAARHSIDAVLGWDFDRVVVGHGAIVLHYGKRTIRTAFAWM